MPKYDEMYHVIFRACTKAIDILQTAQQETEEIYISSPEPSLTILHPEDGDSGKPQDEDSP